MIRVEYKPTLSGIGLFSSDIVDCGFVSGFMIGGVGKSPRSQFLFSHGILCSSNRVYICVYLEEFLGWIPKCLRHQIPEMLKKPAAVHACEGLKGLDIKFPESAIYQRFGV